jgi:hypothetical protein
MAEDSGAFKTNQRNSAQIGHFVIARDSCGKDASPPQKHRSAARSRAPAAYFVTNSVEALRYSRIGLIRGMRNRLCGHRVPFKSQRPDPGAPAKAEPATMLPGFRFLFAAIILSMSVLVFGLGAAALLRAAHEQFASMPSRQPPPETVFAQPSEAPAPTLALLRVEPPVEEKTPDNVAVAAAPTEQAADAAPPAEPEKLAVLKPEEASPPEAAKPDISTAETPPDMPAAPAPAETPASTDEPKLAAITETPPPVTETAPPVTETAPPATEAAPPVTETAPVASEQPAVVPSPETSIAATRIATLGGPAVAINQATAAKADATPAGKRAQRARERRRIARRARIARQAAAAQPQANPFAQPAITPGAR